MEALDPVLLDSGVLEFRCATLHADRAFKELVRLMKADTIEKWANAKTPEDREALHADLLAVDRLAKKVESLANSATFTKRKDAVQRRKADRRPGV